MQSLKPTRNQLTGGSRTPFNPSLKQIIDEPGLHPADFIGSHCFNYSGDCTALLNEAYDFINRFPGQEANQGTEPLDRCI